MIGFDEGLIGAEDCGCITMAFGSFCCLWGSVALINARRKIKKAKIMSSPIVREHIEQLG